MSSLVNSIVVILTAVVGLATLSVVLSKNAQTTQVIQAGGNAFSAILNAAVQPVTGNGLNLSSFNSNASTVLNTANYVGGFM
jgi:hypothetical protein